MNKRITYMDVTPYHASFQNIRILDTIKNLTPMRSLYKLFNLESCFVKKNITTPTTSIGILVAGNSPDELIQAHGTYDDMVRAMFTGKNITIKSWNVYNGEFPESVNECDGYIITGSKSSAYEPDEWIRKLKALVKEIHTTEVPLVGICFGHQVIARALGGQVVDTGEFVMGIRDYQFQGKPVSLIATHGDQVKKLPKVEGITVLGSAEYCKYMALKYGDTIFSTQVHPEFTREYLVDAIALRDGEPEKRVDTGSKLLVDYITTFLLRK